MDFLTFFVIAIMVFIYMIPTIVACGQNTRSQKSIIVLNILLGWTVIAWVALLITAIYEAATKKKPVVKVKPQVYTLVDVAFADTVSLAETAVEPNPSIIADIVLCLCLLCVVGVLVLGWAAIVWLPSAPIWAIMLLFIWLVGDLISAFFKAVFNFK